MTSFYVAAAILAAIAIAWVALPLWRHRDNAQAERRLANLAIFRDQFAELNADVQAGTLSAEQYAQARLDLDRRALEETAHEAALAGESGHTRKSAHITAIVLAIAVPLGAAALYWQLGSPGALRETPALAATDFSPAQIEQMVAQLDERMQKNPDDPKGWAILARSYYAMGRYADAARAYAQLQQRVPPDADVLTEHADALAMAQGRNLSGAPLLLLQQAIMLDPEHWKTLALLGTEAFDRKDYQAALRYWQKLLALVPRDAPFAQQIAASVEEARKLAGGKATGETAGAAADGAVANGAAANGAMAKGSTATPAPASSAATVAASSIAGTVSLARDLTAKADAQDTVFVFARAAKGPPMPLAVMRMQVKDLPATFKLDDSQAMTPDSRLSQHAEVIVGARVAKHGTPMAQAGDLQGFSAAIKPGTRGLNIVISEEVR